MDIVFSHHEAITRCLPLRPSCNVLEVPVEGSARYCAPLRWDWEGGGGSDLRPRTIRDRPPGGDQYTPPTPSATYIPHHPRSQPQLRIRGKSIFSSIASFGFHGMERNSKDHFLFCKTRNCFSLSLTKVLWETSNATRSDLFLLRRILVWHFSGGWIFFKLTRKSFQQKQIRIAVLKMKLTCPFEQIYHQDVMAWPFPRSVWCQTCQVWWIFCSKIFHCNCYCRISLFQPIEPLLIKIQSFL